ncbi:MAG: hypothetical protein IT277_06265, partial [Ignavibacteriaceae bacterium]|nr:hypothetical protein [Ignavibacteriaceae bacterium]
MYTKIFFGAFHYAIIIIAAYTIVTFAQNPCPTCNDLLDKGWGNAGEDPHTPIQGNMDEFAATDPEPFILKVNEYPPVKSFPINPSAENEYSGCSDETFYYFSFDTDDNYLPINFKMPRNLESSVKTYKVDQNGNYLNGYEVTVYPPDVVQPGNWSPDFVMKYDGSMHDVAWIPPSLYPWGNIVTSVVTYIPQSLIVSLNGVNSLNYNEQSEFIADINGGGGNYRITWSIRNFPSGNWQQVKQNLPHETYYNIYGHSYIFYDDEYKFNLTMPDNDIELKVVVIDNDTYEYVFATKVITVNPEEVTFINHIETSENYGELIINENHSDPISSGDNRDLIFGNNYTIRTDELPFLVDWNPSGKTEKHHRWVFELLQDPAYELNHSFLMQATTPLEMKSTFQSTEPASIKTFVDGIEFSGLDINFNDPWYYYKDGEENWFQSDVFNSYPSPVEMYNNSSTSYGGIFLNLEVSPDNPYYSVQSPLTQTKNLGGSSGTRTFYFQNWSTSGGVSLQQVGSNPPGYDQKAVVFTTAGATVYANLKGQLMSSDQNGISSGSQRKLVRTDNGIYHCVYESMGDVWYTHSLTTNFNGQWHQDICISNTIGNMSKNPSIDFEGNKIKTVSVILSTVKYSLAAS